MYTGKQSNMKDFEIIFKRNYQRLCMFAYQFLENVEDARDVVNDVFEQAWKNYSSLKEESVDAYLYSAVKHRCLNFLEHKKVKHRYIEIVSVFQENIETDYEAYEQLIEKINSVCSRLPDRTRYILSQCYFHHKKYKEVSEELGITTDAVKKHIMKALRILRESINKNQ
ncbi:RNA polymerase sigma-70 factor [Parabacteroides bouchesdurhonensis]|uniref:RNA polymerase sigma-70 factor n=2 Tax=Parabacteroides bouchesdurhonensis TaxID=1936995 RepID=UPI000E4B61DF|nr:RNA polymerase sigma-70 factor [Bacteroides sp. AM07-16]